MSLVSAVGNQLCPKVHDFSVNADDIKVARQNIFWSRRALEQSKNAGTGEVEASEEYHRDLEHFTTLTGLLHSELDQVKFSKIVNSFERLPFPVATGEVVPTDPDFPAHYAPPSGGETIAVFSLIQGDQMAGKTIICSGGNAQRTDGKTPKNIFWTISNVGVANLHDVQHWLRLISPEETNGYICRSHMQPNYAPSSIGVRRAFNSSSKQPLGKLDRPAYDVMSGFSRLIVLDVDKVTSPADLDVSDLRAVMDYVLNNFCPSEIAPGEVDLLVAPSASYGTPDDDGRLKLGLRIIGLANRPITGEELGNWCAPSDGSKVGCDRAMGTTGQPVFTVRAAVDAATGESVADPFAHMAWIILEGRERFVPLPSIIAPRTGTVRAKKTVKEARPPTASGKSSARATDHVEPLYGNLQETLAAIGEGSFHAPLKRAAAQYLADRNFPPNADREAWIVAQLTGYIVTAPERDGGGKTHDQYIAGLPSLVHSIAMLERQSRTTEAREREAILAAEYPVPTMTADEAAAELLAALEAILCFAEHLPPTLGASAYRLNGFSTFDEDGDLPGFDPTLPFPERGPDSLAKAVQVYQEMSGSVIGTSRVMYALQEAGLLSPEGLTYLAAVSVGVGKTHTMAALVNELKMKDAAKVVVWSTADHALAAETALKLNGAKIYRGRPSGDEDVDRKQPDGWCKEPKRLRLYQYAGGSPDEFCFDHCPFGKAGHSKPCGYMEQRNTLADAKVQMFADGLAATTRPIPKVAAKAGWKNPNIVVVDEPSVQKLVIEGRFTVAWFVQELNDMDVALEFLTRLGGPLGGHHDVTPEQFDACNKLQDLAHWFSTPTLNKTLSPARLVQFRTGIGLEKKLTAGEQEALNYGARYEAKLRHRRLEIIEAAAKVTPWLRSLATAFADGEHAVSNDGVTLTVAQLRAVFPLAGPTASGHRSKLTPDVFQALRIHPDETDLSPMALEGDKRLVPLASWNSRVKGYGNLCEALTKLDLKASAKHVVVEGWYFKDVMQNVAGEMVLIPMLHFSRKADKSASFVRVPTILLDATAHDDLIDVYAPGAFVHRIEAAAPFAKLIVHQVRSAQHAWLGRVDDIDAVACKKALGQAREATGVICPKDAADALKQRYKGEDGKGEPPYLILHHGALLGRNEMENVAWMGVFGRSLAASADIAKLATALTGEPVPDTGLFKPYAGWQMRSGEITLGRRYGSKGGRVSDALVREITESGLKQAIGRARGCRRTVANPVTVELFIDCAVEGQVADEIRELAHFDDALKGPPWRTIVRKWLSVMTPISRSNRFWCDCLEIEQTAWNHRRQEFGGMDELEANAKAQARADKDLPVVRFATAAGQCIAVGGLRELVDAGYEPVLLTGEGRRKFLRDR